MADSQKCSYSDKLAIALTCVAGVMAIALFLIEKTPVSVVALLVLMLALSVYPILNFAKSKTLRIICLIAALVGTVVLGWAVWPKPKPLEAAALTPSANTAKESSGTTDLVKADVHHPTKDIVAAKVSRKISQSPPKESARQDNSVHADNGSKIEQQSSGDCSPNIVGGGNTVNCGPPPPPPLKITWESSPDQSRQQGTYTYMVTISVNTAMSPVAIAILCDANIDSLSVGTHKGRTSVNERDFVEGNKAFVYYEGTPLDQHDEMYVTLNSRTPLTVLDVRPARIKGLND